MITNRLILIISIVFAVQICFFQNLKCDSIYKPNKFHPSAKCKRNKVNLSETILNELYCKSPHDSVNMKMETLVFAKREKLIYIGL